MAKLLYLVHRLPYPPNKGDKVRSYHLLKHLVAKHRVFLGTFVDDAEDEPHVDTVRALCAGLHVSRLHPLRARAASLLALAEGEPLTLRYYRDAPLQRWVSKTVAEEKIDAVVVFSSSMAQYLPPDSRVPMLLDFVDVDSAKWSQFAEQRPWPLSWLYRREGERLLAFERTMASRALRSYFVTEQEAELFRSLAPEIGERVEASRNGVDADYFCPDPARTSPFDTAESAIVFTGAMDYWPNVDAVSWFAREVMPGLRARRPAARFHIVGRYPTAAVKALAGDGVVVTGGVPDVRPYLQHAAVVVAPLRVARGIQNKILEAMSMARPVVVSQACTAALQGRPGGDFCSAEGAEAFGRAVERLLDEPEHAAAVGRAAREHVRRRFSWDASLSPIDRGLGDRLDVAAVAPS